MRKDYAKGSYASSFNTKKKNTVFTYAVILGIIFFLFIAWFLFHNHSYKNTFSGILSHLSFLHKKQQAGSITESKNGTAEDNIPDIHFTFYDELPKAHMTPPPKEVVKKEEPKKEGYILQLGVFKDLRTASQFRLELLFNGIESEVVKYNNDKEINYRVQSKPYVNMPKAKIAQQKAKDKGHESTIKPI